MCHPPLADAVQVAFISGSAETPRGVWGAQVHDLAVLTFQTDQSFGTLANRMIARGLIERVPSPGRAIRHRLTDSGCELLEAGGAVLNDVLAQSFGALTDRELQTFDRLLRRGHSLVFPNVLPTK